MIETIVLACESSSKNKIILKLLFRLDKDGGVYGTRDLVDIRNINKKLSNRLITELLEKKDTWEEITLYKDFPQSEEEIKEFYEKKLNRKIYHIYKFKLSEEKYEN